MIWALLVLPVVLLAAGFPIFVALLAGAAVALAAFTNVPLAALHQSLFGGVDNYALLAVPFFVFAGELMARGGIAERLVDWVLSLVGHVRGSLGLTTVGTATLMGAISGSSPATVAAVGRALYPTLLEKGYGDRFSLGLITSSGAMAIVIPPSIAMILYGAAAEQSVPRLFLAGLLPGLLIGGLTAAYIVWTARRRGVRERGRFDARRLARASARAAVALAMPVIILGGIYSGVVSPTEAAGVACLYAMLAARYALKSLTWRQILEVAGDAAYLTAQILIIVAAAGVFSWLLTVQGVPQGLVAAIAEADLPAWVFLLAVNGLLLVLGCVVDPLSAILVLSPILVPVATALGIDPIHFGIVMTVNLSIGMFTPPFGLNLFVAQSMLDPDLAKIYRGILPFLAVQILALAIITYVPGLALLPTRLL
ncbi:MAG: TRAP transporter large permease [Azospirillaceae bacterium]